MAKAAKATVGRRGRHAGAWSSVVQSPEQQFSLKRDALLREASRAFSKHGYHDTSLEDVAKSLDVTKAALYYYVTSKQEILFECHKISMDLGEEALAFSEKNGKSGLEKITLLIGKYIELITSALGTFAVLSEFDALSKENKTIIGRRRDKFDRHFRKMIAEGIEDGTVRSVDPKLTVFFFMGAINWMTRWFKAEGPRSGDEISKTFVDLIHEAIKAR